MDAHGSGQRFLWALVGVVLASVATVNTYRLASFRDAAIGNEIRADGLERAAQQTLRLSYAPIGDLFSEGGARQLSGPPPVTETATRLLAIVGEGACGACETHILAIVRNVTAEVGKARALVVVVGSDPNYPRALAATADLTCPLLFDTGGDVLKWLRSSGIDALPFLAVLDRTNKVAMAHVPVPGQTNWTEEFGAAARRFLVSHSGSTAEVLR